MSVVIVVSLLVAVAAAVKTVSCIAFECYCKISKYADAQYVSSARLNFKMKI